MSENHQPKSKDNESKQPLTQDQDQELDDASLDEITGGTNNGPVQPQSKIMAKTHEMKKSIIGNFPR